MYREIPEVEQALVAMLEPLKASHGVRLIRSYGDDLSEKNLPRLLLALPACLVIYAGEQDTDEGQRQNERATYIIFVCDKSLRDEAEARSGGPQNPGVYVLLGAVRKLLNGQYPFPNMPVLRKRQETLVSRADLTVCTAHYEISQPYLLGE